VDIEDRNFHWETQRNGGADVHFGSNTQALSDRQGFRFRPAPDRSLQVYSTVGIYHPQPEWCQNIPHPIEQIRGQTGAGDAFSPGWFELPLPNGGSAFVVVTAESELPHDRDLARCTAACTVPEPRAPREETSDLFGGQLARSVRAYVVRRGPGKTVMAGYPWFLDWGRDSLICARGLLAAGLHEEIRDLLKVFGRWAEKGTLPNSIHGDNTANRDTSDAPLWFCLASQDAARYLGPEIYAMIVGPGKRTLAEVIREIVLGYLAGTPNGIRVDAASGLVWSPGHFTWMDTNFPAGTPREGYPVEIQALWIHTVRLVAFLQEHGFCELPPAPLSGSKAAWRELAARAQDSFTRYFWLETQGWLADVLLAKPAGPASSATPDTALRSNGLLAITLDLLTGDRARRGVEAARRYLVVPGALRTLAPLPVTPPLPIYDSRGQLLNNPAEPYWGRYEGDEDTRRKPAYHRACPTQEKAHQARCWSRFPPNKLALNGG
jgi:predicted glycogen debranching enzyme